MGKKGVVKQMRSPKPRPQLGDEFEKWATNESKKSEVVQLKPASEKSEEKPQRKAKVKAKRKAKTVSKENKSKATGMVETRADGKVVRRMIVYPTVDQFDQISKIAALQQVDVSSLVAQAIDAYLDSINAADILAAIARVEERF